MIPKLCLSGLFFLIFNRKVQCVISCYKCCFF
uniref:Uncharacterized protein n=1 Tax=Anguilla anguilla TaxID=7936 RepID=A0A0E9RWC4_ANGAN